MAYSKAKLKATVTNHIRQMYAYLDSAIGYI